METTRVLWINGLAGPAEDWPDGPEQPATWSTEFRTPDEWLEELRHCEYQAVVLEFPIPNWNPAELLEEVQRLAPGIPVLVRDPDATLSDAVRMARLGVYQFLEPGDAASAQIEQAIETRTTIAPAREEWAGLLVGESREMRQVSHIIRMVGSRRATVLITGETGTGKELAARALHMAGTRSGGPMVAVNCSALPENLLEAELFGHVRGAFTERFRTGPAASNRLRAALCFWTKSANCPWNCKPNSCACCRSGNFNAWAARKPFTWISGWWRQPTATCWNVLNRAGFAKTCTIG